MDLACQSLYDVKLDGVHVYSLINLITLSFVKAQMFAGFLVHYHNIILWIIYITLCCVVCEMNLWTRFSLDVIFRIQLLIAVSIYQASKHSQLNSIIVLASLVAINDSSWRIDESFHLWSTPLDPTIKAVIGAYEIHQTYSKNTHTKKALQLAIELAVGHWNKSYHNIILWIIYITLCCVVREMN